MSYLLGVYNILKDAGCNPSFPGDHDKDENKQYCVIDFSVEQDSILKNISLVVVIFTPKRHGFNVKKHIEFHELVKSTLTNSSFDVYNINFPISEEPNPSLFDDLFYTSSISYTMIDND